MSLYRIKGNINREGERIYHLPDGKWYEPTRISTEKGERWFCSEAEAADAGVEGVEGVIDDIDIYRSAKALSNEHADEAGKPC